MSELFFLQRSFRVLKTGANVLVLGRYQVYYSHILLKKLHTVNYLSVSRKYVTSQCCCLQTGISNCLPFQAKLDTSHESVMEEFGENLKGVESKIIFNSLLESKKVNRLKRFVLKDREAKEKLKRINDRDPISNIPIALKYMLQGSETSTSEENTAENILENEIVQLPYRVGTELNKTVYNVGWQDSSEDEKSKMDSSGQSVESNHNYIDESQFHPSVSSLRERLSEPKFSNWMMDYECYDEYEDESGDEIIKSKRPWQFNYGTPKRNVPASKVPCGGCGALLHCRDTAIPGYLPSEIFEQQDKVTLRSTVCQRCHFLRVYNTALNVIVSPDDYPKLLGHVRDKMALIILMTDLLDFPCSIWPGIIEIVGDKHPIFVVGNKVDLLPPDSRGYLHRIKECLTENLKLSGIPVRSIKHVALISAKTGYGVEELITKLHNLWKYKGDVYVVGCTNVGKSTLFNALLQSDYCKIKAVDLVQRATTSPWPGTTINLLKFPILRPSDWRLYERTQRILSQRQQIQAQHRLHKDQLKEDKFKARPALIGHIGMTFYKKDPIVSKDLFSMGRVNQGPAPLSGLDPADKEYAQSKWCYDTPGAVHPEQVLHLLTTEELMLTLPKKLLLPKTFRMKPNMTLFIAGLGRLDYLQGDEPIKMTVFVPKTLPITICQVDDADSLYEALVGSKLMAVPCGGPARMAQWPGLNTCPHVIQLQGIDWKMSCGDILLSSAGWIAITLGKDKKCKFRAWTPGGRGVYVRQPALLPFAVNFSGPKVRASPAYRMGPGMYTTVQ